MFVSSSEVKKYYQYKKKHLPTIKRIPSDDVWNEVKDILPKEKPHNTKGHPAIPFRKVLDGILFVLRIGGCHCKKMLPRERIWLWLNLPQKISGVGQDGRLYSRNYGSGY